MGRAPIYRARSNQPSPRASPLSQTGGAHLSGSSPFLNRSTHDHDTHDRAGTAAHALAPLAPTRALKSPCHPLPLPSHAPPHRAPRLPILLAKVRHPPPRFLQIPVSSHVSPPPPSGLALSPMSWRISLTLCSILSRSKSSRACSPEIAGVAVPPSATPRHSSTRETTATTPSSSPRRATPLGPHPRAQGPPEHRRRPRPSRPPPPRRFRRPFAPPGEHLHSQPSDPKSTVQISPPEPVPSNRKPPRGLGFSENYPEIIFNW